MQLAEPILASWKAELHLEFERREGRTVLAKRRHDGPLVVQKPLYPGGDATCHAIVVHPPAGIAGGDELEIAVRAAEDAHALLTTPGAGKWYRSGGAWARQRIELDARDGACIEWLPQETIVYDGALADIHTEVRLAGSARFGRGTGGRARILSRIASGERRRRSELAAGRPGGALPRPLQRGREALLHATLAPGASGGCRSRSARAESLEHVNGIDAAGEGQIADLHRGPARRAEQRQEDCRAQGRQHRRPSEPGRIALSLLRTPRCAEIRTQDGVPISSQHR